VFKPGFRVEEVSKHYSVTKFMFAKQYRQKFVFQLLWESLNINKLTQKLGFPVKGELFPALQLHVS
jgi:hypothetical protein